MKIIIGIIMLSLVPVGMFNIAIGRINIAENIKEYVMYCAIIWILIGVFLLLLGLKQQKIKSQY